MDMSTYVAEIEEAATALLELAGRDRTRIADLTSRLRHLEADFHRHYDTATRIELWDDDTDIDREANLAGLKHAQKEGVRAEIDAVSASLEARRISVSAIAGALLQLGKQGISAVHTRVRNDAPPGPPVGGQPLRDVIWEGRNHSMHWEEGNPHPPVVTCFDQLALDFDPKLGNYRIENVAKEVIEALGWHSFDDMRTDLLQLA